MAVRSQSQSPTPPPLQSQFSTLLLFLLLVATADAVGSTTALEEHQAMLDVLRDRGYKLFSNAIATSDLQCQLLASASPFTLFAPKDSLLFSLDMISDSSAYVSTLRYHVIPNRRHTFLNLQNLSSPFLDTLLPHYSVLIGKTQDRDAAFDNATVGVMADGVRVSAPDLFLGSRNAVHGIDGILVTGLNMYQEDLDGGPEIFSPAESPAALSEFDAPSVGPGTLQDQAKKLRKKKRGKHVRRPATP